MLFHPPPRITLKLKMPKSSSVGNGNPSFKSANGPLCPDNSGNVAEHPGEGLGQGKPQLHGNGRRDEHPSNGQLSSSDRARVSKSNGLYEKIVSQKNKSSEASGDQYAPKKSGFLKAEHFGRPFKEATISLVRTGDDLLSRDASAKDRLWAKPAAEHRVKTSRSFQDSDGYCPDLELSDSEPEAPGQQQAERPQRDSARTPMSRGRHTLGSRHAVQR